MSERPSSGWLRACSGLMYPDEPIVAPSRVTRG